MKAKPSWSSICFSIMAAMKISCHSLLDRKTSLHFPVKCIQQCLDVKSLPKHARALDLGCAVGRSSFELSRYCDDVTGIDNSKTFINAAKQIQHLGSVEFFITEEGTKRSERTVMRPVESNPERIHFHCGGLMDIFQDSKQYEVIFAANLICRLPNPLNFLNRLSGKIVPGETIEHCFTLFLVR